MAEPTTIRVLLFGQAKELVQQPWCDLVLSHEKTVGDLRAAMKIQFPALQPLLQHCRLAVGQKYALDRDLLNPNDEIALIPPVSGG